MDDDVRQRLTRKGIECVRQMKSVKRAYGSPVDDDVRIREQRGKGLKHQGR
jgi:hypothetical protein